MKNVQKLGLALACLLVSLGIKAVVADPTPYRETLPDGRTLEVVLHGDEYHSYKTDLQGNLVAGHLPTEQELQVIHQRKAARKMGGHFPLTGTPHSLVILMEFPDLKYTCKKADFDSLLMQSGYSENGGTGSCRDYFIACSDSLFQPVFDVYGPYQADENMEYYGDNDDQNAYKLIIEACQLASDAGVDITQYDTDNDGVLDNVFVYYAGHNAAEGGGDKTIWPHKSDLSSLQVYVQGKQLASYACTSELKGSSGNTQCAIGTFCHEFGHVLGLPDWYDTSGKDKYTIGGWSIMSSGNYNNNSHTPPSYNAYERFFLGWLKPQQLSQAGSKFLSPLTESNEAYLIAATTHNLNGNNPDPTEFFIMENRQKVGWDAPYLPGTGMLIWHVDYKPARWNANNPNVGEPMLMHLEEAGGRMGSESATDPYPGTKNITSFTPVLHDGTSLSNQPVFSIGTVGLNIRFVYINTGEVHLQTNVDSIAFVVHKSDEGTSTDWASFPITIHGWGLDPDEVFSVTSGKGNFYISQNPSAVNSEKSVYWSHNINLSDTIKADSTFDATFYACYKTKQMNCTPEVGLITIQSALNAHTVQVSGSSPREVYVTTPKPAEETDITPYAFTVHWSKVKDAELYDMELYQSSVGESEFVQSFEDFDNIDAIHRQGWESTTNALTSSAKKEGQYALYIQNTGDQVTSEIYPATATTLSFWVNAFSSTEDSVGQFTLEGWDKNEKWKKVETITITNRTKDRTYTFDLDQDKGYTRFRLTYTRIGGQGLALDAFTVTTCEKITYVYSSHPLSIEAVEGTKKYDYTFTNLLPNSTYFYQLRCSDGGKGCQNNFTAYSKARAVTTLNGEDPDGTRLTIGFNDDEMTYEAASRVIYLPRTEEGYSLYIFEIDGHLVWSTPIETGQSIVYLPDELFTYGQVYVAKYMETGKMSRKDKWVKFIYR